MILKVSIKKTLLLKVFLIPLFQKQNLNIILNISFIALYSYDQLNNHMILNS